ncbi:MAG: pyridoxamine 5'-phosphate oxidase family protein [Pseudomonadota bacterium]
MDGGWTDTTSPFHPGEQQVQERLGLRDKIEGFGRRVIRDYMPEQHRAFYQQLPFVLIGTVDERGRPWASLVAGEPGFMSSPDPRRLEIGACPLPGDPLHGTLREGADVGLLGIELGTRRRNRLTGNVAMLGAEGFAITIEQAFGNCPQYIQTRKVRTTPGRTAKIERSDRFDARTNELITQADTLFIATAYADDHDAPSRGADVSHRGGKPGFVQVEDDRTLVFPDFSGNNHFNTVGNLVLNPRAGLLFVDFTSGELVYLTGAAEIVWEGEDVRAFAGAERLIRVRASEVIRVTGSLPLSFDFGEYSPTLEQTGSWAKAAEIIAADKERSVYLPYHIERIEKESDAISSFYLRRADGKTPASYQAGQFLPIRVSIPGQDAPLMRTYTLSDAPGDMRYRLSIKREGGDAVVSTFLHDHAKPGFELDAMAPRGRFAVDRTSDRPLVLLSAGVGVTPMIAMLNATLKEGKRTRRRRRIFFVHGARSGREHAFGDHLLRLADEHEELSLHVRFSKPGDRDRLGENHDSVGHVDISLLTNILPFDDFDFYLCGPQPFMQALYDGLTGLGVRETRIHYEAFGPATVLKHDPKPSSTPAKGEPVDGPVGVRFSESEIEVEWTPTKGTLLELAEEAGVQPDYACRSGICGTCATKITCGAVDYLDEPSAPIGEDEVLICCATPRSTSGEAGCGKNVGVALHI